MEPEVIAFLDSGIGGLPYLAHARAMLPAARYVYVADRENFPYGGKSRAEITAAISSLVERILKRENPLLIVIACNTASVSALDDLRALFPIPFVGVVPAVKPAAALSRRRRVGVLATQRTVEGEYLKNLIKRFAEGCSVVSLPASGLVEFVERRMYRATAEEKAARVRTEVDRFREGRIDALVLGCTHLLHLEREFRRFLDADGITLVDSREGVSRQVARLADGTRASPFHAEGGGQDLPPGTLYVTGSFPLEERYKYFAGQFHLELSGCL